MSSSISGLASGLDTATIINQLMQLEATSQNRLKAQQTTQKSVLAALQALNTDTALLAGKAASLAKATTWQTLKGTSSSSDVSVALGTSAAPSSLSLTVLAVAANHQLGFADAHPMSDFVVAGGGVGVTTSVELKTNDGVVHTLATGSGTLQELVDAVNLSTKDTGVTATAVGTGNGGFRLLVQSTATGDNTSFTLKNTDQSALLGDATIRAGADAKVDLGAGITATSHTSTFTDLLPGVSVTLAATAKAGTTAGVTVAQDPSGVKSSVKALVDQLNALISKIDAQTAPGTSTAPAGVLAGDAMARGLRSALVNTVFGSDDSSMAAVGIQTDRFGKLVFDEAAFTKAYAANPAAVAAQFTTAATVPPPASQPPDGWAARLAGVATTASDATTGTIGAAITGRKTTIDRLADGISAWDMRLELRRTSLTRQYTALETALSSLQSQGNWLAGQLNSLPSSSS